MLNSYKVTLVSIWLSIKYGFLRILGPKSAWEYEQEKAVIDYILMRRDIPELLGTFYRNSAEVDRGTIIANLFRMTEKSQDEVLRVARELANPMEHLKEYQRETLSKLVTDANGDRTRFLDNSVSAGKTLFPAAVVTSTVMTDDEDYGRVLEEEELISPYEVEEDYFEEDWEQDLVHYEEDSGQDYGSEEKVEIDFEELTVADIEEPCDESEENL